MQQLDKGNSGKIILTELMKMAMKKDSFRIGKTFDLMYVNPQSGHFDPRYHFAFLRSDGKEIYLRMKKKGVLIRHFDTPRLRQYNRITVGSRAQMEIFLKKLKEVLEELQ